MSDDELDGQWWPADSVSTAAMRDGETVYAVLGPRTSQQLIALHDAARDSGITIDDAVDEMIDGLRGVVGGRPDMLALMALAAAVTANMMNSEVFDAAQNAGEDPRFEWQVLRRHIGEVFKLFGWQVEEMLGKFGFNPATFSEYVRDEWSMLDGAWPPAAARYTRHTPEGVSQPVPSPRDPLAPLKESRDRLGRPTLYGSGWVQLDDLDEFTHALVEARKWVDDDLRMILPEEGLSDGRALILSELEKVLRAADEIREVQVKLQDLLST